MSRTQFRTAAFTLIELLVVISIIAVLMGLAFPVFQSVQNSARRTQAKNDLVQIVTAVNAFYTEYGKYPNTGGQAEDVTFGEDTPNLSLIRTLAGRDPAENPRAIEFFKPLTAQQDGAYGVALDNQGIPTSSFHNPWSTPVAKVEYRVTIDGDYDGQISDPEDIARRLPHGVIAWSPGKNASAPKIYSYR